MNGSCCGLLWAERKEILRLSEDGCLKQVVVLLLTVMCKNHLRWYLNIMSTRQSKAKNVVAPNDREEDDLGVLIYRGSQLRKAEAAIAAESKKKSTVSAATRTSTRKNNTTKTTSRNKSS